MQTPAKIGLDEFRLIRDYIEKNCGICLTDDKMYLVCTRLTTLMVESGCNSFADLYHNAVADRTNRLRDKIIEAITTNETFWFRDKSPFAVLDEELLGKYTEEIRSGRRWKINIWCTACSTGQEPYSVAMTILEFVRKQNTLKPEHVEIVATDISSAVLYLAMAGRYDSFAMSRGLSDDLKDRYFKPDGNVWVLNNEVKKMVTYKKLNLQENFSFFGRQDIIFCRNILFYFSDEFKKEILGRVAKLLRPNGYLFLGASESIFNYTHEYEMLRHTIGLYYKVKEEKGS